MHVAAAAPKFLNAGDIDEDFKNKEAEIYKAQLRDQGKPEEMLDKIVMGKLNKLASEVCLMEQKFVKDPDLAVKKLVENTGKELGGDITVKAFHKINLGEGIEKKEDNLAEEVAKMTGKQ
jgi:elongation factor Ts